MYDGSISSSQIQCSDHRSDNDKCPYECISARYLVSHPTGKNWWCTTAYRNNWFQISFEQLVVLTGFYVEAKKDPGRKYYPAAFQLAYTKEDAVDTNFIYFGMKEGETETTVSQYFSVVVAILPNIAKLNTMLKDG